MKHGDVDYDRWNPEAKALLVCFLLWFVHGGLMPFSWAFVLSWAAHNVILGVWGFTYLWRTGTQRRRKWAARQAAMQRYFAARPCHVCGTAAGECNICHALPGERCDVGLHS